MVFYTDIDKSDNTFRFSQGSVDHAYYGAILRCNRSFAASYGDGLSVWRRFYEYDNTYFRRTDGGIGNSPYSLWNMGEMVLEAVIAVYSIGIGIVGSYRTVPFEWILIIF